VSKPFSARNLVASVLLGTIPPRLSSRRLVALAEAFGITEGTTRVALTRMVERGELINRDGTYELTGSLRERQDRQEASFVVDTRRWTGGWELFVVDSGARHSSDRVSLRRAFARLRVAERRDGVWLRPDNLDANRLPVERAVLEAQVDRWTGRPEPAAEVIATDLFNTDAWAATAGVLIESMDSTSGALVVGDHAGLAPSFVLSAEVVRHLVADPMLPAELLPADWPGQDLRDRYRDYNTAYRAVLVEFFAP
jgi:phenylacetic acid degradation operon negative regulatory protein